MRHTPFLIAIVLATAVATPGRAASSFQLTCSNIEFVFSGNQPALQATCLSAAGTPMATSLVLTGISNQNGVLTQGSGASSFQQSCGNIMIEVDMSNATLSAFCRTASGSFNSTKLPLNNIGNNNGRLVQ